MLNQSNCDQCRSPPKTSLAMNLPGRATKKENTEIVAFGFVAPGPKRESHRAIKLFTTSSGGIVPSAKTNAYKFKDVNDRIHDPQY